MGIASMAVAGIPDLTLSTATTVAPAQVSLFSVPNGTGKPLTQAKVISSGTLVDATITVTLRDGNGDPIYLYPAEDLWLETNAGGMVHCNGGTRAAFNTNASGQTTFVGPFNAGKQSNRTGGEKTVVMVSGSALSGSLLDILFNSPDIDGNLIVNLSDTVLYATDAKGAYNYRSDFYFDNLINLSDTVLYAQGLSAACP